MLLEATTRSQDLPGEVRPARRRERERGRAIAPPGAVQWQRRCTKVVAPESIAAQVEMHAIKHALACEKGNKTRAAQLLGISRQTLRTKLKEHALDEGADDASD